MSELEKSYDSTTPTGKVTDLTAQIAARAAEAVPAPTVGTPSPSGSGQPAEGIGSGQPVMLKTYVRDVAGSLTPVDQTAVHAQTSPPVDPKQQVGAPGQPGGGPVTQPGETIAGSDGSMVTTSPSESGTGRMIPGVGQRAPDGAS